ncbi:hypothetical protein Fmac_006717 [Flemingia macrophylla]|uniref:Uncharacterized protein n=1 Tax=Flemingia macrophylla TaxID=520843 RepID=A0ABD1NBD8_9FABA
MKRVTEDPINIAISRDFLHITIHDHLACLRRWDLEFRILICLRGCLKKITWELTAAWSEAQITVPVKFIVGDLDVTYINPGAATIVGPVNLGFCFQSHRACEWTCPAVNGLTKLRID